jgi:hypothetical protein
MYACPHCSALSISAWRKVGSSPLFPATCAACLGESVASGWGRAIVAVGGEVLIWGSLLLALALGSLYGLLLLPIGLIALTVMVGELFPLVAIDAGLTKTRRRAKIFFWVVLAAGVAYFISMRLGS